MADLSFDDLIPGAVDLSFDDLIPAGQELPAGVTPSTAGQGRSSGIGGATAQEMRSAGRRRGALDRSGLAELRGVQQPADYSVLDEPTPDAPRAPAPQPRAISEVDDVFSRFVERKPSARDEAVAAQQNPAGPTATANRARNGQAVGALVGQMEARRAAEADAEATRPGILGDSAFGTALATYGKFAPILAESIVGLVNVAAGGALDETVRDIQAAAERMDRAKSSSARADAAELSAILKDPEASPLTVIGFLASHPGKFAELFAESLPYMALTVGTGLGAGVAAGATASRAIGGQAASSAVRAELQALQSTVAARGAMTADVGIGSAMAFNDPRLAGESLIDRYNALAVTGAGYALANRLTGGGADTMLATGARGSALRTGGKEGAQEVLQTVSESAGAAAGSDKIEFEPGEVAREATLGGAVGFAAGAGASQLNRGPTAREGLLAGALQPDVTPIRPEAMPTTVFTPEDLPAVAAGAYGVARPVGVLTKPNGALAVEAEAELQRNAQENADVGSRAAAVPVAGGGGDVAGADAQGGLAAAGRDADVDRGVGEAVAGVPAPGSSAAAEPASKTTTGPLNDQPTNTAAAVAPAVRNDAPGAAAAGAGQQPAASRGAEARAAAAAEFDADRARYESEAAQLEATTDPRALKRAQVLREAAQVAPVLGDPGNTPEHRQFNALADAMESLGLPRPVAYLDTREETGTAADGFERDGRVFVNLANPDRSVAFTIFHETQHVIRARAGKGDKKAQLATRMLDEVWAMIPEGKKVQYAQRYLFGRQMRERGMTVQQALADPKLKDEMLSDFMGQRADDVEFMQGLARKHPDKFGAFVTRWIDTIRRLIGALRGRVRKNEESIKSIDNAIINLERAKLVAERVLVAWADMNPRAAKTEAAAVESARLSARSSSPAIGAAVEVAPNPDDTTKVEAWRELSPDARKEVTEAVGPDIARQVLRELGDPPIRIEMTSGSFEGEQNPSLLLVSEGASFEEMDRAAKALGYVFDQKAVVVFDESDKQSGNQASFVKVLLPDGAAPEQIDELRRFIAERVPQANGDTLRDGALVFGNFSGYSDAPMSDGDFYAAIQAAVAAAPGAGTAQVIDAGTFRSEYIEPGSRDGYLEGIQDEGDREEAQAGRDGVRGRGGRDGRLARLSQLAEEADRRRDERVQAKRPARAGQRQEGADREVTRFSARESDDKLGAFNPFRDLTDVDVETVTDEDYATGQLTPEQEQELQEALDFEQAVKAPAPQDARDYRPTSPEALERAGIAAEDAFPPLTYRDGGFDRYGDPTLEAAIKGPGYSTYRFTKTDRGPVWRAIPEQVSFAAGRALSMMGSERGVEDFNRRVAASIHLFDTGFDLFTAVPAAARKRVLATWQAIGKMPGAAEFKAPKVDAMVPSIQRLQQVATSMTQGTRFTAEASAQSANWFGLTIADTKAGVTGKASIEYVPGADKRLVMHAADLDKGSGLGKAFYQVAFAFAHEVGIPTQSDSSLTGVNTYRRTEQMVSAAVRAGTAGAINPGVGQRVYGWNKRAADKTQKDRNFVRLLLAAARNAIELAPRIRELKYDLATDRFSFVEPRPDGNSSMAGALVQQLLADQDARAASLSRSTLARAAITLGAIRGDKIDESVEVKTPVLYSARGSMFDDEYASERDPFADGYKALEGRAITLEAPLTDTGGTAQFRFDAAALLRATDRRLETAKKLLDCLT